jgi:carboxylate-amine ligase
VEFRICDVPLTVDESIAITALFQAICAKIYKLRTMNMNFIQYSRALINENKWRASRYGIDGFLIDFGKEEEINTRVLLYELLDFVDDVVDHLGSRHRLEYIHKIIEGGTGADRQLAVYEEQKNLESVTSFIQSQFLSEIT